MRGQLLGAEENTNTDFPYGAQIKWDKFYVGTTYYNYWLNAGEWCQEHFGRHGDVYIRIITVSNITWWFRSEQDQMVFILRNGVAQCMKLNSLEYQQVKP